MSSDLIECGNSSNSRRRRSRVTPLRLIRIRAAMVLPESLRTDVGPKSLQPAVDVAIVVVARVICGPADGVLIREDITDMTLSAMGVRHASSSVVVLLAELMTKGVGPPCFRDAKQEVLRHARLLEELEEPRVFTNGLE